MSEIITVDENVNKFPPRQGFAVKDGGPIQRIADNNDRRLSFLRSKLENIDNFEFVLKVLGRIANLVACIAIVYMAIRIGKMDSRAESRELNYLKGLEIRNRLDSNSIKGLRNQKTGLEMLRRVDSTLNPNLYKSQNQKQ
jgi:hypothetical protein